jgi:hypothetical protein
VLSYCSPATSPTPHSARGLYDESVRYATSPRHAPQHTLESSLAGAGQPRDQHVVVDGDPTGLSQGRITVLSSSLGERKSMSSTLVSGPRILSWQRGISAMQRVALRICLTCSFSGRRNRFSDSSRYRVSLRSPQRQFRTLEISVSASSEIGVRLAPKWPFGFARPTQQHRSAAMAWRGGPTGVEEQGMCTAGFPRNLGDPAVSAR